MEKVAHMRFYGFVFSAALFQYSTDLWVTPPGCGQVEMRARPVVSLSQVEAKGPIIVKIDCFHVFVVKAQNIRTLTIAIPQNQPFLSSGKGFGRFLSSSRPLVSSGRQYEVFPSNIFVKVRKWRAFPIEMPKSRILTISSLPPGRLIAATADCGEKPAGSAATAGRFG